MFRRHASRSIWRPVRPLPFEEGGTVPEAPPEAEPGGAEPRPGPEEPKAEAKPEPKVEEDAPAEEEAAGEEPEQSRLAALLDKLFGPLPTAVQKWLKAHGDKPVSDFVIRRAPVQKAVRGILDLASLGALGKAQRKVGYDALYHLWLEFKAGGLTWAVEKNQTLKIRDGAPSGTSSKGADSFPLKAPPAGTTMADMFEKAVKRYGAKRLTTYDPFSFNCQKFIAQLLSASGLLTSKARAFVMQDVSELAKDIPGYVKEGSRAVTDTAAVIDRILQALSGGRIALRKGGRVPRVTGAVYREDLA